MLYYGLLAVPLTRARYYLAGRHLVRARSSAPARLHHATPMVQGFRHLPDGPAPRVQLRSRGPGTGTPGTDRRRHVAVARALHDQSFCFLICHIHLNFHFLSAIFVNFSVSCCYGSPGKDIFVFYVHRVVKFVLVYFLTRT